MNKTIDYKCPKCETTECDVGELRATGGFFSKIFDVQSQKFTAVTCKNCKYTELFKADSNLLGNIFDLFTN